MNERSSRPAQAALLMVGSRLVNMAVGLLTVPVLIRYLGGEAFAAWAILLAVAAGFSLLELGMSPTLVRFLAVPARDGRWDEARRHIAKVWLLVSLSFLAGLVVAWEAAGPLAKWARLPDTPLLEAADAIRWVCCAVALRAFVQTGVLTLYASRRFAAVSAFSLLQPLCSNVAAMLTAWKTGRLDLAVIAFWTAQVCVLLAGFVAMRSRCLPLFGRDTFQFRPLRELLDYGVASQMEGWAQFVNFQFDKFLVAGLVGLWGVAPYEVGNRAVAALRSVPASGAETFLPLAMVQRTGQDHAWQWYAASTKLMGYGVCVFILAPLAVSPLFLYAWTGEMGYVGRWVFAALSVGAAAGLLALPAATLAQAHGWPRLQSRAALLSVAINIPLSYLLVIRWEMVGAACGTAAAMAIGALQLLHVVHSRFRQPLSRSLALVWKFWPPVLVCAIFALAISLSFEAWIMTLDPAVRFSRALRKWPGLVAVAAYFVCTGAMGLAALRSGLVNERERSLMLSLLRRCRRRVQQPQ